VTSGFVSPVADGMVAGRMVAGRMVAGRMVAGRMVAGRQFEPGAAAPRNQYSAVFEDNFIPNAGRRI